MFFTRNNTVKPGKVITGAIAGTTVMTLTSYAFSALFNKNFKEPKILSQLIARLLHVRKQKTAQFAGWCLHYSVGLLFAELYGQLWEKTRVEPTVRSGLIFGGMCGFAAILVWKFTLSMHPDPPPVHFVGYAIQLFIVHLIFGAFTAIGYNLKT